MPPRGGIPVVPLQPGVTEDLKMAAFLRLAARQSAFSTLRLVTLPSQTL